MAEGYPEGALEHLQAVELEVLEAVANACEQLGLAWFLDSGTCLGSARHGGFIPWDDDVDIALPLEDYRIFCAHAAEVLPEGFGIYTHAETKNYAPLWAKVYKQGTRFMSVQMADASFEQGIFVDVFAYIQLDSDARRASRQMRRASFWQRASYLYHTAHPKLPENVPLHALVQLGCKVAHGVLRMVFSPAAIERRFTRWLECGDGAGVWCDAFYPAFGTFNTETLFPPVQAPFEDRSFPVPHNVDTYLTTMYGNYNALPPVEQRGAYPPVVLDFGDGVNVMELQSQ